MQVLQKAASLLKPLWHRIRGAVQPDQAAPQAAPLPQQDGQFVAGHYTLAGAGSCAYRLFVPPQATPGQPLPLLVMLHGCTQNPEDFAHGTGMNLLAQQHGVYVLYPEQPDDRGLQRCWSWFARRQQQAGRGEPALIAGLTHHLVTQYGMDPQRVYIAGLSAGGAMAALVARLYPQQFAALGVFAGMAPASASGMWSALMAMRRGGPSLALAHSTASTPLIVFQGDADKVVHPSNATHVLAAFLPAGVRGDERRFRANQRNVTHTRYQDQDRQVLAESWLVHGGGHAWSGSTGTGSYTDPLGPDASREMLRFFLQHALPA